MKNLEKIILVSSLIFIFGLVYSPHFSYKYPLHADEYQHIAKAVNFLETKNLNVNPYFYYQPFSPNLESGFTIFLSILIKLGFDPITSYRFLPALFATLAAFILFHLILYLTKSFYTGIFSILFFASLKSNINMGGLWFFTPLTLAIPLIFLSLLLFFKAFDRKNNKLFVILTFFLLILFLIHPISGILVYILIFLFLFLNKESKKILILLALPLVSGIFLFFVFSREISELLKFVIDWLILEEGWGYNEVIYFLPAFYNYVPFILGLIGVYPALKNLKLRLFIVWFFISISLLFIFNNFKLSILFPYQRVLYYSLLSLVPLSAFGSFFILGLIKKYKILIPIFIILVGFFTFYNYYDPTKESKLYYVLDDNDYDTLIFLKQFPSETILAPLPQSAAVYPVSGHYVIGMTQANLLGGEREKVKEFYDNDCETKLNIINQYQLRYILSKSKLDCNFLKEIYNEGDYIYEV